MRDKIKVFLLSSNNSYVSGEELSQKLNVSRTAIWKHIEELKKEGYQIEAVRKKGYRLLNDPDDITAERIINHLNTVWLGQAVHYEPVVESTQFIAHELAKNGAKHGTIVLADEQTKGKGRLGRTWFSANGTGIWMSMILRPSFGFQLAPLVTLFTSVMLTEALKNLYQIPFSIKWPNDIYFQGKKVSGILTEIHGEQDRLHYLIIGIGINTHKASYPEEIKDKAISIEELSEQTPKRSTLIKEFLRLFEKNYDTFISEGFQPFYETYNERMMGKGQKIEAQHSGTQKIGKLVGIAEDGYLLMELPDQQKLKIIAGDIHFKNK